jgi:hypothetical protein
MVKRQRVASVQTYDRSFGDWLVWLGPGILCLIGASLLAGFCIFFHYYLPGYMLPPNEADALAKDRMGAFEKEVSISAYLFHPGIELWIFLVCIWLMWKCLRFAFKRLVLNYMPPEKIKLK